MIRNKNPVVAVPGVLLRALRSVPGVVRGERVPGHCRGFSPGYDVITGLRFDPVIAKIDGYAGIVARISQLDVRDALGRDRSDGHVNFLLSDCQPGLERREALAVIDQLP